MHRLFNVGGMENSDDRRHAKRGREDVDEHAKRGREDVDEELRTQWNEVKKMRMVMVGCYYNILVNYLLHCCAQVRSIASYSCYSTAVVLYAVVLAASNSSTVVQYYLVYRNRAQVRSAAWLLPKKAWPILVDQTAVEETALSHNTPISGHHEWPG